MLLLDIHALMLCVATIRRADTDTSPQYCIDTHLNDDVILICFPKKRTTKLKPHSWPHFSPPSQVNWHVLVVVHWPWPHWKFRRVRYLAGTRIRSHGLSLFFTASPQWACEGSEWGYSGLRPWTRPLCHATKAAHVSRYSAELHV